MEISNSTKALLMFLFYSPRFYYFLSAESRAIRLSLHLLIPSFIHYLKHVECIKYVRRIVEDETVKTSCLPGASIQIWHSGLNPRGQNSSFVTGK